MGMDFEDAERKRSYQLNMLVGLLGCAFLLVFGVSALSHGKLMLGVSMTLATVSGLGSLLLMRQTGKAYYGACGVSLTASYVFLYLIISGGVEGSGPLWCYPLLTMITFLQGLRRGIYMVFGLIALTLVILFMPNLPVAVAAYSTLFKARFVASLLALAIMTLIYEYLRGESQARYRSISSQLDKVSRTDELTGVANRREMNDWLAMEYAGFLRHGLPFSVIMVDLDRFKQLNDSFGHAYGDQILLEVAKKLAGNVRQTDHVARWGGEEFLILLAQTELTEAARVAEKLRLAVAEIESSGTSTKAAITASMGVQSIVYAKTIESLISQADERLYQAKNGGRNLVVAGLE